MPAEVIKLPTGYEPAMPPDETPVSKREVAERFGVSTRTVDRWIERDRMPQDTQGKWGCWIQVGAHRRFYLSRVRQWLEDT